MTNEIKLIVLSLRCHRIEREYKQAVTWQRITELWLMAAKLRKHTFEALVREHNNGRITSYAFLDYIRRSRANIKPPLTCSPDTTKSQTSVTTHQN
jgi:hypothetical protein